MGTLPFVSVVVPTRNRAELLRVCLASLLAQEFPGDRYEIIVVDDGSADKTSDVVRKAGAVAGSAAVRYVASPRRGLNVARNAGIAAARGDPIAFVDDDVDAPPSWLRELVEASRRHPEAGCLGGRIVLRLEGKPPTLCGRERLGETELDLGGEDLNVAEVWGANMAVRRSALEQVGLFLEELSGAGDEMEWELRYRYTGGRLVYIPGAWLWHRRTAESLTLLRLLNARFRRGYHEVAYLEAIGQRLRLRSELARIPRFLGHAVWHGCAWGLLATSGKIGRCWAIVAGYLRGRRGLHAARWRLRC